MPRDGLEPVTRQLARREVVAQHGVERVDQLAARRDEAHAPPRVGVARPMPRRAARCRSPGGPMRPSASGTPSLRARAVEERQVEAMQVVVLDHVRIGRLHRRDQPADQVGLGGVALAARPRALRVAPAGSRTAIMKMRSRAGVEPGGLEIELQAAQLVEREVAEVRRARSRRGTAPRGQREDVLLAELAQVRDGRPRSRAAACSTAVVTVRQSSARTRKRSAPVPASSRTARPPVVRATGALSPSTHGRNRSSSRTSAPVSRGAARRWRARRARPTPRRCRASDPSPTGIRLSVRSRLRNIDTW